MKKNIPSKHQIIKWLDDMVNDLTFSLGATKIPENEECWEELKVMIAKTIHERLEGDDGTK